MNQLLALDFGGTFVKYSIIDKAGNIIQRAERPAPLESTNEFVNMIRSLYETSKKKVDGIAVSMPGIIDSDKGIMHAAGAYTPILAGKNLFELLQGLDTRIAIENDGKAAILAEAWKGTLKGIQNAAAIIIGSGLAGGIIINGKLYKGLHYSAAEFSCLPSEIGNYTPISSMAHKAGMSALLHSVARAKEMDPTQFEIAGTFSKEAANPNHPIYSGRDVFHWIDEGDPVTCRVYQHWLDALVHVIYILKLILDPDKIVIGGGVSREMRLLNDIKQAYEKTKGMTWASELLEVQLERCQYTADANMVGAVYNWMLHFEKEPRT